jgi:integrase
VKEELLQTVRQGNAKDRRRSVYLSGLQNWLRVSSRATIGNNQRDARAAAPGPCDRTAHRGASDQSSISSRSSAFQPTPDGVIATATQHLFLWVARQFWVWAIGKGYAKMNPWLKVRRVGKANVGKVAAADRRNPQARSCGDAESTERRCSGVSACLLMLYLGLRQGEVAARVVRDIDDDGRVLWIPSGKTRNAKRRLKIPEQMRPLVLKRIQGKNPDELIFYPPNHKTYHRGYFVAQLARLCRLADVPVVCPHGLRGMHATLALEGGATSDAVAKALGHGSFEMTKTHYASASSVANNESGRVAAALAGQSPRSELDRLLNQLGQNELESLLIKLRSGGRSGSDFEENRAT